MSVLSPLPKNEAREIRRLAKPVRRSVRRKGMTAAEVRAALLRAAYLLHTTRVVGWRDGVLAPKKG
jgi:hypothetical protein